MFEKKLLKILSQKVTNELISSNFIIIRVHTVKQGKEGLQVYISPKQVVAFFPVYFRAKV